MLKSLVKLPQYFFFHFGPNKKTHVGLTLKKRSKVIWKGPILHSVIAVLKLARDIIIVFGLRI